MILEALTGSTDHYAVGIITVVAVLAVLYTRFSFAGRKGALLPPGPPARWFWSNALPAVNIAYALTNLVREYGPVVSFRQGSQVIIAIGSVEAAVDIMEKEGGSLVDRPRAIAASEILSNGLSLSMARYGERFRRLRKAVHPHLQPKAAEEYQDMQRENAMKFILDMLNDPTAHQKHAQRYAASVILRVAYGKSTPTANTDPEVVRIYKVAKHFQATIRPGAYLVDRVPLLRYLPGYGKQLYEWHREEVELFRHQLRRVKSEMDQNKAGLSFTKALLENTEEHKLSTDEMSYLAGSLFRAGSDTTAVGITATVMAAACHPLAQAKVHEELDMVIGLDRAPTFDDSSSLPQLHAFLLETLRWRPIVRIGVPHCATKDILWRGYCIPKGATVYGCHWTLSRDPIVFPDPEIFNPQRWLDSEGRLKENNMKFITYGFGRRACPGLHLANRSLYITLALLLWSFRIVQRPDAPINTQAFSDAVVSHAAPFEIDVIPRVEVAKLRAMMMEGCMD
ncbi:cytochrome P450 [Suillus fuscotomentosus]|uniref:Cytochrome P450 n=1 Tax=Suillus fuscotomentosus TaxID=1912939 RepID=A0AAD4HGI9_9AGAM|nr:cytochrome P450 [Suillus fuscotomentosus]KAG1895391.1 cytochrome P450 [Suillus fuscotomentosus]